MAQSDSAAAIVEPLKSVTGAQKPGTTKQLASDCRVLFFEDYTKILEHFFSHLDDELFTLSDKANNSIEQTRYFDAMRYMRKERSVIQSSYVNLLYKQYDRFWQKAPAVGLQLNSAMALDSDSLSLIENEMLEEDLAISMMIDKGNSAYHRELDALNKRLVVLSGRKQVTLEENPLAPHLLCNAFKTVTASLALDADVKLYFYLFFEKQVVKQLADIYHGVNEHLIQRGILPEIKNKVKRSKGGVGERAKTTQKNEANSSQASTASKTGETAAHLEVFQGMQSVLGEWRKQAGIEVTQGTGPAYESDDVLSSLSMLQAVSDDMPTLANQGDLMEQGLKHFVTRELQKLQPSGESRPLNGADEDVIDMLSMIFGFILDDDNLPDPIKVLIGRLQIPLVKIAIMEKAFFAEKQHPARLLLNSLAQAGVGIDEFACASDPVSPVFVKIKAVVERVLTEFEHDTAIFSELLDDFSGFVEQEELRSQRVESRTLQTSQSQEQRVLAKRAVKEEITARIQGKPVPRAIHVLLYDAWADVLELAYLRREKDPSHWKRSLLVVDELIRSVTPVLPLDSANRRKMTTMIVTLVQNIRRELDDISFDTRKMAEILKNLQACHVACLSGRSMPDMISATTSMEHEVEEEIILGDQAGFADSEDRFMQQASSINVGQWLEFTDENDMKTRVKLSWKSQVASRYVFVNRKGVKRFEKSASALAVELRRGTAKILSQSDLPLMERAFSSIMKTIKGVDSKQDNDSAPLQEMMA